jgi:hypothetical protein
VEAGTKLNARGKEDEARRGAQRAPPAKRSARSGAAEGPHPAEEACHVMVLSPATTPTPSATAANRGSAPAGTQSSPALHKRSGVDGISSTVRGVESSGPLDEESAVTIVFALKCKEYLSQPDKSQKNLCEYLTDHRKRNVSSFDY